MEKLTEHEMFTIKHYLGQELANIEFNIQEWENDKVIQQIFIDRKETILSILEKIKKELED